MLSGSEKRVSFEIVFLTVIPFSIFVEIKMGTMLSLSPHIALLYATILRSKRVPFEMVPQFFQHVAKHPHAITLLSDEDGWVLLILYSISILVCC